MKVLARRDRLDGLGATAVFVAHDSAAQLASGLLRGLDLPFPVVIDLERVAYKAWGCGRASVARVWLDPMTWLRYAASLRRGGRPSRPGTDTLQLGGDFVVDGAGTVVYARPQRRDDRPPVSVLLRELSAASARA